MSLQESPAKSRALPHWCACKCVSWTQVGIAGAMGAVGGAYFQGLFRHSVSARSIFQASWKWNSASRRIRRVQGVKPGEELHHWLIERNSRIGKMVPEFIKNHPFNLKRIPEEIHRRIHGNIADDKFFKFHQKWWYGTPAWAKSAEVAIGAGVTADLVE